MRTTALLIALGSLVGAACSKAGPSPRPAASPEPAPAPAADEAGWLDEATALAAAHRASRGPWDLRTCPAELDVARCSQPPALPPGALLSLEEGIAVSWCSPDGRIVVRCFGDAPEGPFGLRSVARVDADGVGFSRVDEDTEAGAIALQLERVRMLPDGARRELTVEWEDPSAGPSQVAMSLVREQLVVRSETRDHGMLSSDERCLAEQGAHLCTRRSFEGSGELYRTLHIYERPRLCLEASLDTWKDGAPQWVYVDRDRGPLATLLEQAHAAWGGPPSPDEHELVVLSWKDAPPGDEPGLELRILREDAPCDGPAAGTLARGELVGEQLCFETCDTSVFGQCVDRGCRPLSPDLRERLLADARREAEQRLAPLLDAEGS